MEGVREEQEEQSGDHCKSELNSFSSLLVHFLFCLNNRRIPVPYKNKYLFFLLTDDGLAGFR